MTGVDLNPFYFPAAGLFAGALIGHYITPSGLFLFFSILVSAWGYTWAFNLPATSAPFNNFTVHYPTLFVIYSWLGVFLVRTAIRASKDHRANTPLEKVHSIWTFGAGIFVYVLLMASRYIYGYATRPWNFCLQFIADFVILGLYYLVSRRWIRMAIAQRQSTGVKVKRDSPTPAVWNELNEGWVYFLYIVLIDFVFHISQSLQYISVLSPDEELYTQYIAFVITGLAVAGVWMCYGKHLQLLPSLNVSVTPKEPQGDLIPENSDADVEEQDTKVAEKESSSSDDEDPKGEGV